VHIPTKGSMIACSFGAKTYTVGVLNPSEPEPFPLSNSAHVWVAPEHSQGEILQHFNSYQVCNWNSLAWTSPSRTISIRFAFRGFFFVALLQYRSGARKRSRQRRTRTVHPALLGDAERPLPIVISVVRNGANYQDKAEGLLSRMITSAPIKRAAFSRSSQARRGSLYLMRIPISLLSKPKMDSGRPT